jgi:rod shape-determining protein MreC
MAGARRAGRRRYVLLVIVLTCLTLITLDSRSGRTGPLGSLGRLAHQVMSPIEGAVNDVTGPIGDWWSGLVDSGQLKRDNRRLEQENAALRGQQIAAAQAIKENEELKKLLDLQSILEVKSVNGLIVGRDPGNFDPTLTIDKGSESGISVDMPVIAPEGIVGKVIEVWNGGSKIQVLTDPQFSVGVQTPGHGLLAPATTGIASGQVGSHDLAVDFDAGTKVLRGDAIVTSPQSTLFPPGLPVGTIRTVTVQPGDTGVNATINPYVHLGALQHVTVLLWPDGHTGPVLRTTTTTSTSTTTTTFPGSTTTTTTFSGSTTPTTGP